ncbi:sugar transferase [Salinibacterium hongtaonis]|nr:sugar transferase [Salinibacterium hongtaonis]
MKRFADVLTAGISLVLLSPILLVVAILVRAKLGSPVIFSQPRPGKHGRVFMLYKFRTMANVDAASGLISDAQRLTTFGRRLRSTSLDELPTLVNVLRGDMSIVGPRPLLVQYLGRYSEEQARRHEVRPGITGLAQVNGRNALSWDQKFELDVAYVDARSPLLDISILGKTVTSVLTRDGISQAGHVTAREFMGRLDDGAKE